MSHRASPSPGRSGAISIAPDVSHVLDAALLSRPGHQALVGSDRTYTYEELDAEANAAAGALASLGIGPGDRVAACLPNDTAVVVAFHAAMRLGAIWVGLNQLLSPLEKSTLLGDCGARVLICDSACSDGIQGVGGLPPTLEHVLSCDPEEGSAPSWAELIAAHRGSPVHLPRIDPDAPAAIAYTSGTTGAPKGVVHSQASLLLPGAALVASRGYGPELRKGDCLALTILNLLVLSTLLVSQAQGTCIVMNARDASGIAGWIRSQQVTTWNGVPTMLYDLVHDPAVVRDDLSSLHDVWSGGSPCPESLRAAFEEKFGQRVHTTYGLTEAPTVVAIEDRRSPSPPGSSGRVLPHLAVGIFDDTGHRLPAGESGEIHLGPPDDPTWASRFRTMSGYWGELTTEPRGTLATGDIGYLDDGGNLFVIDRKQLVILRGGANVYPAEVESVLETVPGVKGCAVIGIPDERLGERVAAVLEIDDSVLASGKATAPAPGPALDPASGKATAPAPDPALEGDLAEVLREHCLAHLARYKVPDRFVVVDALPRNAMGKVRRDALAASLR